MEAQKNNEAIRQRMVPYKSRWSLKEDRLLTSLVDQHGPGKWDFLAQHIKGRTGKSCRLRWINQLNPRLDRAPFSDEEQRRLLQLHERYGNKWSMIVCHFPGRTDNHVKNTYHSLVGSRYVKGSGVQSSSGIVLKPKPRRGAMPAARYFTKPTVPVGSQSSNVSCQGNNYSGFADPASPAMSNSVSVANVCPNNQGICCGDSVTSDAKSAALYRAPQPQQGGGIQTYQFIDFLGIGNSE
ncbi:hypothetical protein ABFS83_08G091500 [Erythranthe nasuta]